VPTNSPHPTASSSAKTVLLASWCWLVRDPKCQRRDFMPEVPTHIMGEIYQRLQRIQTLAKEVEAIPNFGPDVWTMREGDKKCQQIGQDADWIWRQLSQWVGTGDSP
jgi:hypothetical protein